MTDRPQPANAPDNERSQLRWQRTANIGLSLVVLATIVAVLLAHSVFQDHLRMSRLFEINATEMTLWREIGEKIDYLLDDGEMLTSIEGGAVVARVQKRLTELVEQSEVSSAAYHEELVRLNPSSWRGPSPSAMDLKALRQSIPEDLKKRAEEASIAKREIIRAGFSHWSTATKVIFQSGKLTEPLRKRGQVLRGLIFSGTEKLWGYLSILSSSLIGFIFVVWLALWQPAMKNLSDARRELRLILDNIPALVTSYSPDGLLKTANRSYLEKMGYPKAGAHISEVVGPEGWSEIRPRFESAADGNLVSYDLAIRALGGKRMYHAQYVPFRNRRDQVARVIALITDVHDRTESARALEESEERLRITLNSIGDAVISTNLEGLVERMNPAASRLTGWNAQESVGRPLKRSLQDH